MTEIIYKDVAPYSKKDSTLTTDDINSSVSQITDLKNENLTAKNYASLEHNRWKLDGSFETISDVPKNIGWWSKQISDENGVFETPIVLTRTFSNKHTSVGIRFCFDKFCGDYCNSLNVKWYNDDVLLFDNDYTPDNVEYYCKQNVESFNKITVTFYSMNKGNRFLKIYGIEDGTFRIFRNDELQNVNILEEMSAVSDELSMNTLDFSIDSKDNTDYIFQKKQPFEVLYNNKLLGVFYAESSQRQSKSKYKVSAEDTIGLLDKVAFYGGVYDNITVEDLINEVMNGENISYIISDDLKNTVLSGYLPISTKREALAQILFASGGNVTTSRRREIYFFRNKNTEVKNIEETRIYSGGTINISDTVTAVKITYHQYVKGDNTEEVYNGDISSGDNYIEFSDIIDTDSINVEDSYTIKEISSNHIVIYSETDTVISIYAKKFTDNSRTKIVRNQNAVIGTAENIITVENATLVTASNVDDVCMRVFEHQMKNKTLETDIVIKGEQTGDKVTLQTEWSGEQTGIIEQLDYDIQNKMIGKAVVRIE